MSLKNQPSPAHVEPLPASFHVGRQSDRSTDQTETPMATPTPISSFAIDETTQQPQPTTESAAAVLGILHRLFTESQPDRPALLQRVIDVGCHLFHADEAVVLEIRDGRCMPLASHSRIHNDVLAHDQTTMAARPIAQTIFAQAFQHAQTYRYRTAFSQPNVTLASPTRFDRWIESIVTPIPVHNKIFGVLAFGSSTPTSRPLTIADHTIVEMLCRPLAHHFEIAYLETERIMHKRQHEALAELGQAAVSGINHEAMLHRTTHLLARTLNLPLAAIFELDGQVVRCRSCYGRDQYGSTQLPTEPGSYAHHILARRQVSVSHFHATTNRPPIPQTLCDAGMVCGMAITIPGSDRPFGFLGAYSHESRVFTDSDRHFMQRASTILAEAVSRARYEKALAQSEYRYRMLVDHASDYAMITLDTRGRITACSRGVTNVMGYEEKELLNKNIRCLFPRQTDDGSPSQSDDQPSINFDEVQKSKRVVREGWRLCRNGKRIWVISVVTPIYDQANQLVGYAMVLRNRTDRKHAEEKLRRSEMRYRAIVEDQTELICRMRRNGTITFVNQAFCKYYNRERKTLIDDNFFNLIHPQDRPRMIEHFRRLHSTLPVGTVEYRTLHADDPDRWMRWTIRWLSNQTKTNKKRSRHKKFSMTDLLEEDEIQAVGQDITGRKISEQALQRSEAEQRELAERSKILLRELDHRVKNNLAGLYSLLSIYESSSTDVQTFARSVRGKVMAMKTVHELTATNAQSAIDLTHLVELLSHQFPAAHRQTQPVTLSGPPIKISSQQVAPMAMSIQELFTNSQKYGALSLPTGSVNISWRWLTPDQENPSANSPETSDAIDATRASDNSQAPDPHMASDASSTPIHENQNVDKPANFISNMPGHLLNSAKKLPRNSAKKQRTIEFVWQELGVDNLTKPEHFGVGLDLITGFAQYELGGSADFDFSPTGLCCTLRAKLDDCE